MLNFPIHSIVMQLLDEFAVAYEDYLRTSRSVSPQRDDALRKLAEIARRLLSFLTLIENVLRVMRTKLESGSIVAQEDVKRLSILLESTLSIAQFSVKLLSLEQMYDELAPLFGISTLEHPVKIVKIESGSLWADILGYPKIIDLMESLISGAVSYMYRNFTKEGKITSIPRKVESIDSILQLRSRLKDAGIDTISMDENIQKSSVIVAEQLNRLLGGEAKVTINGQVYSVEANLEQKYLEERNKLLLPEPATSEKERD